MSQYANLKAAIAANVYQNHNNQVTANMVKAAMNAMTDSLGAGYQYLGIATPATTPGTPDQKVFYIAPPGEYPNFGTGISVADGEVAVLKYDTAWHKEVTGAATAAQVTELGQETNDLEHIVGKSTYSFKTGYYWRVDRQQEVAASGNAYLRIPVLAGDKFIVTGNSTSSVAPFICLTDTSNTNHISDVTEGNNYLYTVEYDGYLVINNTTSSVTPSLTQTSAKFQEIDGRLTSAEGRLSSIEPVLATRIGHDEIVFSLDTIFNGGNVSFVEGKSWNTAQNKEVSSDTYKYARILLYKGVKIKITANSTSASAKLLAVFPLDGSATIVSEETSLTDYEYTMPKDGYLVVNTYMASTSAYVKIESDISKNTDSILAEAQKIGITEETLNLTSSDYLNLWSNGIKIFSSNLNSYNGFLVKLTPRTKYFWTATTFSAVVLSAYPVSGATDSIIGSVQSGFIATEGMKYLLLSIKLDTTTQMVVTTTGYGIKKDANDSVRIISGNSIANVNLVRGTIGGSGRIIASETNIVTKEFIDISQNILAIANATPINYCYYDANRNFKYLDSTLVNSHLEECAYVRLVFNLSDASKVSAIYNGFFCNPKHSTYKDLTLDGVQISDGLKSTSASGVITSYDKTTGLIAAIYAGAWLEYGERGDEITLAIFPAMQPSNVKYATIAKKNESMGNGHIFAGSPDTNIIYLGNRVWRTMVLNYRGTPSEAYWIYRDYHYDTDTLDDAIEIKMSYGGNLLSLNTDNRKLVINAISGLTDTASDKFVTISSSLDYHSDEGANGTYYGCITGYGYTDGNPDNVYVLLFFSTDNMETLVPFAVFPYSSQFEASCIKIDGRFYCIGRENRTIYHTGYSDDNGATWEYTPITGTNNRPRLYNIGGVPMWCYGIFSTTSEMFKRGRIAIAHSTNPADVSLVLDDLYGLVYFDIFIRNGKMWIAYSSSPLTIDTDNGEASINGKDMVKLVMLPEII